MPQLEGVEEPGQRLAFCRVRFSGRVFPDIANASPEADPTKTARAITSPRTRAVMLHIAGSLTWGPTVFFIRRSFHNPLAALALDPLDHNVVERFEPTRVRIANTESKFFEQLKTL